MKSRILFYMEQSPPMHGVTYINKILFDNLKDESKYSFYNINYNFHANEVGNISVKKVILFVLSLMVRLAEIVWLTQGSVGGGYFSIAVVLIIASG